MKQKLFLIAICFLFIVSCNKDNSNSNLDTTANKKSDPPTIEQLKLWYKPDSAFSINWNEGKLFQNPVSPYWEFNLSGRPTFQQLKLGYRKLVIFKDNKGVLQDRILEIIPDAIYLQRKEQVRPADFCGRIFIYNHEHHLLSGKVYGNGKLMGLIRPSTANKPKLNVEMQTTITSCEWSQQVYVDADYNVTVYDEKICNDVIIEDNSDSEADGTIPKVPNSDLPSTTGTAVVGGSGSGPGGGQSGPRPRVSNLPGESKPGIKPLEYMQCFTNIPDKGAVMKVTIYVQEPFPGTAFNIGPNSVGHVAIGLTKSNGSQSVTQIVGLYPAATGFAKMHASSKLVNNGGDLDYNVSITYNLNVANFNQIKSYVANPPATYDLFDFNCTNFVYEACKSGGLTLPDPTNTVGLSGPGGASTAMTPAGLGSSIENLKDKSNINTNGGTTPNSKGPCN
jgi:hypothetical protein